MDPGMAEENGIFQNSYINLAKVKQQNLNEIQKQSKVVLYFEG